MSHLVVVQLTPKDPDILNKYFAVGRAAVEKHGGQAIAGGPDRIVLEENGAGAPASVVLSFPSGESAHSWINDPDLAEIHSLRRDGANTTITLLPPMT